MSEKEIEYNLPQLPQKIFKNKSFIEKLEKLKNSPISNLSIICDYDDTLTKRFFNGVKNRVSFGIIDQSTYASNNLKEGANNLFKKYSKFELDTSIDFSLRDKSMYSWFEECLMLMIDDKISKKTIYDMVIESINDNKMFFRNGMKIFFDFILKLKIPLILISAGIKDVIIYELKYLLKEKYDLLIENNLIHIIANDFIFNEDKVAIDFVKPIIYTFNKNKIIKDEISKYINLNEKKLNVFFFGDHLNDINALDDIKNSIENILSVAFWNYDESKLSNEFKEIYDAVVSEDGDFFIINEVLKELSLKFSNGLNGNS